MLGLITAVILPVGRMLLAHGCSSPLRTVPDKSLPECAAPVLTRPPELCSAAVSIACLQPDYALGLTGSIIFRILYKVNIFISSFAKI